MDAQQIGDIPQSCGAAVCIVGADVLLVLGKIISSNQRW